MLWNKMYVFPKSITLEKIYPNTVTNVIVFSREGKVMMDKTAITRMGIIEYKLKGDIEKYIDAIEDETERADAWFFYMDFKPFPNLWAYKHMYNKFINNNKD